MSDGSRASLLLRLMLETARSALLATFNGSRRANPPADELLCWRALCAPRAWSEDQRKQIALVAVNSTTAGIQVLS